MAASRCVRCMQCLCWGMVVFVVLRLRFNDSAPSTTLNSELDPVWNQFETHE